MIELSINQNLDERAFAGRLVADDADLWERKGIVSNAEVSDITDLVK